MNAQTIPYHLRPNKAVERNLFMDLLSIVNAYKKISDYAYIGLGGPFLEDFKGMHESFEVKRMISIEMIESVHKRQLFNAPVNCIDFLKKFSGEFIDDYVSEGNAIFWMDYSNPRETLTQLDEIRRLIPRLIPRDIVKITLNVNPLAFLGRPRGRIRPLEQIREYRLRELESRLPEYFPEDVGPEMMDDNVYPAVICKAVEIAVKRGLEGFPGKIFQPLSLFLYADSRWSPMLTATGILLGKDDIAEFLTKTNIQSWKFAKTDWSPPIEIKVPQLSIRERLCIDSMLPLYAGNAIYRTFEYIDPVEIDNYIKYCRYYPYFSKVLL